MKNLAVAQQEIMSIIMDITYARTSDTYKEMCTGMTKSLTSMASKTVEEAMGINSSQVEIDASDINLLAAGIVKAFISSSAEGFKSQASMMGLAHKLVSEAVSEEAAHKYVNFMMSQADIVKENLNQVTVKTVIEMLSTKSNKIRIMH